MFIAQVLLRSYLVSPPKKSKVKKIQNSYLSRNSSKLEKLDRMRGALFVPSLYQESGTFGT